MINKVILIGRTGKEPEMKALESGGNVCRLNIATEDNYKDKSGEWQTVTEWHSVILWKDLAERAEKQIKKGTLVYIEGKLTHRSYQDSEGVTKYITEVRARTFRIMNNGKGQPQASNNSAPLPPDDNGGGSDDLPF